MSESLEKFTSIAKEDHQRAKTLFFSEAFKEEFLKDKQKETNSYNNIKVVSHDALPNYEMALQSLRDLSLIHI